MRIMSIDVMYVSENRLTAQVVEGVQWYERKARTVDWLATTDFACYRNVGRSTGLLEDKELDASSRSTTWTRSPAR